MTIHVLAGQVCAMAKDIVVAYSSGALNRRGKGWEVIQREIEVVQHLGEFDRFEFLEIQGHGGLNCRMYVRSS